MKNNTAQWKQRAFAYALLSLLIVAYVGSAIWTVATMIVLFPFWLLGDRTIYNSIFDTYFPE